MSLKNKHHLVLYEIYPRSFQDSNNDGFGDLPGIISRLDYLTKLGVTALWITPFYPSPMKDVGYDIKDYCNVDPQFGTLDDFKTLVKEAHKRGMDVITDLVINHTSDQHPWFLEARSSRDNPKRDWYIWKDPVNGSVPNNWKSVFDPSAWEFDAKTDQYYFHSFLKEQPDLNWSNPAVMQAVKDICAFWLDLGVDGFRLDAINHIWKDHRYLDEPINPTYDPLMQSPFNQLQHIYMRDQEPLYDIVNELAGFVSTYKNAYIITEAYPNKRSIAAIPVYKKYYDRVTSHNVIPFNFELLSLPWDAKEYESFITAYLEAIGKDHMSCFVLGNHDKTRVTSRLGREQAKAAAVLLLTLPGMPVIYYGEELGMEDVRDIPESMITDTKGIRSPGFGRDPVRTPMQWDDSNYAGFSTVQPWLPLEKEYQTRNVASQSKDPHSFYILYRQLLSLRAKEQDTFADGLFQVFQTNSKHIFAYTRTNEKTSYLILINFSAEQVEVSTKEFANFVLSSKERDSDTSNSRDTIIVLPYEACVFKK
jgi:alpha-glucosidase